MKITKLILIALASLFLYACSTSSENGATIERSSWWRIADANSSSQLNS